MPFLLGADADDEDNEFHSEADDDNNNLYHTGADNDNYELYHTGKFR